MPETLDRAIAAARPNPGTARTWWLGQSGFAVRGPQGGALLVDPFISDSILTGLRPYTHERLVPAPLDLAAEARFSPEIVLVTHEHADHCDNVYLTRLAAVTDCLFVGPPAVADRLRAWDISGGLIRTVEPGARIASSAGEIEVTKAVHVPGAVGYVLRLAGGPALYFAGDTGLFLGMRDIGERGIDAAFLPINGQYDNIGIDGALVAASWLRASIVVPTHYGMFADNTERPERLAHRLAEAGLPTRVAILAHAEMLTIDARA